MMGQNTSPESGTALDQTNAPADSGQQVAQNYDNSASDYGGDFGGDFDSDS